MTDIREIAFKKSQEPKIINAKITSTMLGREDHGIMTCMIHLDYGGMSQGFGGYSFDIYDRDSEDRVFGGFGMEFISEMLRVTEVDTWEKLPGTYIRVSQTHNKVEKIGHILKDEWLDPVLLSNKYD